MMKTKKSNRWECMKALVVLPIAAVAVVAFANPKVVEVEKNVVADTKQLVNVVKEKVAAAPVAAVRTVVETDAVNNAPGDTVKVDRKNDKTYDVVEKMPSFPGGPQAMMQFLRDNIKYPKEAEAKKEQGLVILNFVVNKDGSISNVNVVKPVSDLLDAEALRVVRLMPAWEPGMQNGKPVDVKFTIPVKFSLSKDKTAAPEKTPSATDKASDNEGASVTEADPLYVIDGKEMALTGIKSIGELDQKKIESITVLKDPEAARQYGGNGKNGVVLIKTKSE